MKKTFRLEIRLSSELFYKLKEVCRIKHISMSEFVRRAVVKFIKKHEVIDRSSKV